MVQVCNLSFSCLYSECSAHSCTDLAVMIQTWRNFRIPVFYTAGVQWCSMGKGNLHMVRSWDIFLIFQLVRAQSTTAKFVKVLFRQQMGAYNHLSSAKLDILGKIWGSYFSLARNCSCEWVGCSLTAFAEITWQDSHQISAMGTKCGVSIATLHHVLCNSPVISYHSGTWWPHWEGKCHCAQHVPSLKSRGGKVVVSGKQGKQIEMSAWDF